MLFLLNEERFLRTGIFFFGWLDGVKPSPLGIFIAGRFFWGLFHNSDILRASNPIGEVRSYQITTAKKVLETFFSKNSYEKFVLTLSVHRKM